jgi:hypothetical protein
MNSKLELMEKFGHRLVRYRRKIDREAAVALLFLDHPVTPITLDLPPREPSEARCNCQIQEGYVGTNL